MCVFFPGVNNAFQSGFTRVAAVNSLGPPGSIEKHRNGASKSISEVHTGQ